MIRRYRADQTSFRRPDPLFFKALGVWLSLTLGLFLVCPEVRSDAKPAMTPEEQRVVHHAQQAMSEKRYSAAQAMLSGFMEQNGDNIHYLVPFTLGNALALEGRNTEALACYRKAARRHSADADLWINMGKVHHDLQQFGEAGRSLHKAHSLMAGKKPELLYQAAACFLQDKQPHQALVYLERLCSEHSSEAGSEWFETLIDVHLQLGQHLKAADVVRQVLEKEGDRAHWSKVLAHIHTVEKNFKKAAAAFKVYLELVEPDRQELRQLGDLYWLAGVPLKAARQYELASQGSATENDYTRIAAAYIAAHRPDTAEQVLKQAIERKPSDSLWQMLGSIQYNQGRYREASEAFGQSLNISPGDGSAALFMGYCALKLEKPDEAVKAFETAARFSKQRKAAQQALAEIKRRPDQ